MAIRTDFAAGEVLAAADLNDTFGAKLNLAGGKILQIVRATDTTQRQTSSTSFVDVTGMAVTITPQKSTSAIIILASYMSTLTANNYNQCQITDSSNNPISGAEQFDVGDASSSSLSISQTNIAYATPATTSSVTYKLRFRINTTGTATINNGLQTGQIYAIEVSA